MDDILEVLIYVLFIGASVIGGIYKNYAKKKEEEKRRQRMSETTNSFDNEENEERTSSSIPRSLEDFLRDQFEMEMGPVEEELNDIPTKEKTPPPAAEPKLETQSEGVAAFQHTNQALLSDNLNDANFSISDFLSKQEKNPIYENEIGEADEGPLGDEGEFDGTKAIIYSEILNRRYS